MMVIRKQRPSPRWAGPLDHDDQISGRWGAPAAQRGTKTLPISHHFTTFPDAFCGGAVSAHGPKANPGGAPHPKGSDAVKVVPSSSVETTWRVPPWPSMI